MFPYAVTVHLCLVILTDLDCDRNTRGEDYQRLVGTLHVTSLQIFPFSDRLVLPSLVLASFAVVFVSVLGLTLPRTEIWQIGEFVVILFSVLE